MNIDAIKPSIDPSEIAPERLAGNPNLTENQKISEASRQFEVILLKEILEASQKTVIKSSFSDDDSTASGIYHEMVTNQLAQSISKTKAFGFSKIFEQQLERPDHPKANGAAQKGGQNEHSTTTTISAGTHNAAHLKSLHERTLTKSH